MFEQPWHTIAGESDAWEALHEEVRRLHPSRQLSDGQRSVSAVAATIVAAFVTYQLVVDGVSAVVAVVAGVIALQLCRPFARWMLGAGLEWSPRRRVRRLHRRLERAVATLERCCGDVRIMAARPSGQADDATAVAESWDRIDAVISAVRGIAAAQRRRDPAVVGAVDVRPLAARLDEITSPRIRLRAAA
jgi:hypothetical protein